MRAYGCTVPLTTEALSLIGCALCFQDSGSVHTLLGTFHKKLIQQIQTNLFSYFGDFAKKVYVYKPCFLTYIQKVHVLKFKYIYPGSHRCFHLVAYDSLHLLKWIKVVYIDLQKSTFRISPAEPMLCIYFSVGTLDKHLILQL